MGGLITRADVVYLALFEAVMLPLAVYGPRHGWEAFAALLAGVVVVGLAARQTVGSRRPVARGSAPFLLSFVVGLGVMFLAFGALRLAGLRYSEISIGAVLGFYFTADAIVDRWWMNRGSPPADPATSV